VVNFVVIHSEVAEIVTSTESNVISASAELVVMVTAQADETDKLTSSILTLLDSQDPALSSNDILSHAVVSIIPEPETQPTTCDISMEKGESIAPIETIPTTCDTRQFQISSSQFFVADSFSQLSPEKTRDAEFCPLSGVELSLLDIASEANCNSIFLPETESFSCLQLENILVDKELFDIDEIMTSDELLPLSVVSDIVDTCPPQICVENFARTQQAFIEVEMYSSDENEVANDEIISPIDILLSTTENCQPLVPAKTLAILQGRELSFESYSSDNETLREEVLDQPVMIADEIVGQVSHGREATLIQEALSYVEPESVESEIVELKKLNTDCTEIETVVIRVDACKSDVTHVLSITEPGLEFEGVNEDILQLITGSVDSSDVDSVAYDTCKHDRVLSTADEISNQLRVDEIESTQSGHEIDQGVIGASLTEQSLTLSPSSVLLEMVKGHVEFIPTLFRIKMTKMAALLDMTVVEQLSTAEYFEAIEVGLKSEINEGELSRILEDDVKLNGMPSCEGVKPFSENVGIEVCRPVMDAQEAVITQENEGTVDITLESVKGISMHVKMMMSHVILCM